jgi:hypothetical protein
MKTLVLIITIPLVVAFRANDSQVITLDEAIKQKLVTVIANSNGSFSGSSVLLKLQSKENKILKLSVPAGYSFYPENEGEQTLLNTEDHYVTIEPGKSSFSSINGFCSEHNDGAPSEGGLFTFGPTKNKDLQKLASFMATKKLSKSARQSAVWAVSDNQSVSHINRGTPDEKALRVFVCELKGIKDTWYESPQNYSLDEQRNIVSETINISGNLVFSLDAPTIFHQEVKVKGGETKFTSNGTQPMPKGKNIEYAFQLQVKGWKKGDYEVLLKNDKDKVIGTWDFKV